MQKTLYISLFFFRWSSIKLEIREETNRVNEWNGRGIYICSRSRTSIVPAAAATDLASWSCGINMINNQVRRKWISNLFSPAFEHTLTAADCLSIYFSICLSMILFSHEIGKGQTRGGRVVSSGWIKYLFSSYPTEYMKCCIRLGVVGVSQGSLEYK